MLERVRAERALSELNEALERRVSERTTQLEMLNRNLQREAGEREHAERVLRDSEARVRAVLDSALSGVVVMNTQGAIVAWNRRAEEIFGWPTGEALGRDLADTIIPERYRGAHRRGLQRFLDTLEGPALNRLIELEALHRSGREFPAELSIGVIRSGATLSFCGFVTDITERKQTTAALQSSQRLLQAIVDHSTAVVYVKDTAGRYLLVNRRYEQIFNLARSQILGKTDHEIFPREHADAFRAVDLQVLAAPSAMQMEEVAPLEDGPHTYVSVKCALLDADGVPYALCGISTDITDLKQAQSKQRQHLGQLELLNRITHAIGERQDLSSILQVVLRSLEQDLPVDFACLCTEVTDGTIAVTGIGAKSQTLAAELLLPEQARIPVDQNGLSRCLAGQLVYEPDVAEISFPFPQQLARGGLRALVIVPLAAESRVFGMLVVARHAAGSFSSSECEFLRQLGENMALAINQAEVYGALQNAYDELRQTQQTILQQERLRALGQMASGIAHDINNAILPVAIYTELLLAREPTLTARGREQIETIQRAIDDVAKTVERMREFSRPREPQLALAQVDLNRLVAEVLELTRVRWSDVPHRQGVVIRLRTDLAPVAPVILGAEHEIRDALTNLIFNAVDAMPAGGTLSIATRTASGNGTGHNHASVEIADTGVGMDDATRRRCLEPYFTTKGERGTGLGLAMVYGMVQRHSAQLEIVSEPGKGTTVRMVFSSASQLPSPAISAATPARIPQSLRLLIVDDDPIVLKALCDALTSDGHHVTTADGGRNGIDAFTASAARGECFDVVVTDLGMPYLDGRKVAASIRTASPTTPIILLTGWGQRLVSDNAVPPEVDRVLSKPPKLEELRRTLAELTADSVRPS
jgi:PAS domain S-box-containing protein